MAHSFPLPVEPLLRLAASVSVSGICPGAGPLALLPEALVRCTLRAFARSFPLPRAALRFICCSLGDLSGSGFDVLSPTYETANPCIYAPFRPVRLPAAPPVYCVFTQYVVP